MSNESPGNGANAGAGPQYESTTTDNGPGNGTGSENASMNGNDNDSEMGRTHPAPSLAEAHPIGSRRSGQYRMAPPGNASPGQVSGNDDYHGNGSEHRRESWSSSASPRLEKGPSSSASSPATHITPPGTHSTETSAARYSIDQFSPTNVSQGVFSVNDGSDMSQARRANRRRTGPLTPEQRERAAVMRKLGACKDCRRRRVAVSLTFCLGITTSRHFASGDSCSVDDLPQSENSIWVQFSILLLAMLAFTGMTALILRTSRITHLSSITSFSTTITS